MVLTVIGFLISGIIFVTAFAYIIMFGLVNEDLNGVFSFIICIFSFTLFKYFDVKFGKLELVWRRNQRVRKRNK